MATPKTQGQLDQLAKEITEQKVCPKLAAAATHLVFGEGNPDANIMIIGEAPGAEEDKLARPFVGSSGRLLGQMLQSIGLSREEVYITNIVKYRPPANRDPSPQEVKDFLPYLLKQVKIIKPKLIVTLGRFSLNVFFPELKISQVHGQPKRRGGQVFLPLFHPAVALYDNSKQAVLEADFNNIPRVLELI